MAEILKERGFFWWSNGPDRPANSKETSVSALLTITDDGQIFLETAGTLSSADERDFPESKRISGWLASSGKYVLLEGLERTDFSFSAESPQQQKFSAALCTQRESSTSFPDTYKHDNFVELRIELSGFEDWLELDSIIVGQEYPESDEVNVQVSYRERKFKYPTLGGSLSVESITTGADVLGLGAQYPRRDAQFTQHYYLVFRPDSPSNLSSLRYTYTSLEELLAVFIGSYCRLSWPTLVSKEEPFDAWDTFYFYRGVPDPRPVNRYSIWIYFKKIQDVFGELFQNWLNGSEAFGAGYYLYVSALRNPHQYAEHRFVNLIWSVEALHRKWLAEPETSERIKGELERVQRILGLLPGKSDDRKWLRKKLKYAHELSLEARILECFRKLPFSFGKSELEKFAKTCAERRNDISHVGGPRENVGYGAFHDDVFNLAEALEHLFHVLMLHHIGIDGASIRSIVTDSMVSRRITTAWEKVNLHIQPQIES